MKIQASNIDVGDCVIAYCNQKMQVCQVHSIVEQNLQTVTLSISLPQTSRKAFRYVIRFRADALVELTTRN